LNLDNDGIERMLESMDKDARAIKEEALRFIWWMRGGLSYEDAMMLSPSEKEIINEIIKDNLKATKDSGMPFF
jgi:hypothetical protein